MDKAEKVNRMLGQAQDLINQRIRAQEMNPSEFQVDVAKVKICGQEFQVPGDLLRAFVEQISEWSLEEGRRIMMAATEATNDV
jgi:hypothetical protein